MHALRTPADAYVTVRKVQNHVLCQHSLGECFQRLFEEMREKSHRRVQSVLTSSHVVMVTSSCFLTARG